MATLLNALPQAAAKINPSVGKEAGPSAQAGASDLKALGAQFGKQLEIALNPDEGKVGEEAMVDQALTSGLMQSLVQPPVLPQTPKGEVAQAPVLQGKEATQNPKVQTADPKNAALMAQMAAMQEQSPKQAFSAKQEQAQVQAQSQVQALDQKLKGEVAEKSTSNAKPTDFQLNALKTEQQDSRPIAGTGMMDGGMDLAALAIGLENIQFDDVQTEGSSNQKGAKNSVSSAGKKVGTHSSNLSTDSFLNLRDISAPKNSAVAQPVLPQPQLVSNALGMSAINGAVGGDRESFQQKAKDSKVNGKEAQFAQALSGAGTLNQPASAPVLAPTVDAHVTQGSNQNTILSHDALNRITSQVSQMNMAKQDGEIKLRLRPDHLGELQMHVKTTGGQVSIQIKAHDEQSKKIIEDSLSSLKDSLSVQNLTLGKVDVVTQAQPTAQDFSSMNLDRGSQQGNQSQNSGSQNNDGFSNRNFGSDEIPQANVANFVKARAAAQSSGRLDMIA